MGLTRVASLLSFLSSFRSCAAHPSFLALDITAFAWWGAPPAKQVLMGMAGAGVGEWRPGVIAWLAWLAEWLD